MKVTKHCVLRSVDLKMVKMQLLNKRSELINYYKPGKIMKYGVEHRANIKPINPVTGTWPLFDIGRCCLLGPS